MPKHKCPRCKDTGLIIAAAGNEWCQCQVGREYIAALADERRKIAAHPPKCRCSACAAMWEQVDRTLSETVVPPAPPETLH